MKKRKPAVTFTFFVIGLSLVISTLMLGTLGWLEGDFALDYKETQRYRDTISMLLSDAYELASGSRASLPDTLKGEADNLSYYIESEDGSLVWTNTSAQSFQDFSPAMRDAGGASKTDAEHLITIQDNRIQEWKKLTHGESFGNTGIFASDYAVSAPRKLDGTKIAPKIGFAVHSPGAMYNYGRLYRAYYDWYKTAEVMVVLAGGLWAGLMILLVVFIKHKSLGLANKYIAYWLQHVWMELKLGATAFIGWAGMILLYEFFFYTDIPALFEGLLCFWWCWAVLLNLCVYRRDFFTQNSVNSLLKFLKSLESRYPFLRRMKLRPVILLLAEAVLVIAFLLLLLVGPVGWIIDIVIAGLAVYLLARHILEFNRNMDEFGRVVDYADQIRRGTAREPLTLQGDFGGVADSLNDIYSGMNQIVAQQIRSEKMKVELITNVSHDLKTPLTSIINYADLLGKETLTPDYANDYVRVLAQKSQRLSNMVQDLFEVSKANSGSIELCPERLNVTALVEQTAAEMDRQIEQAGVEVKCQFSAGHMEVWADGGKLHRVFENLLGNALKYSLAGTRVYIAVREAGGCAEISFKNVSSYEMTFTAEEIVERFQRGDAARTTEGSGLGLAIAKSFLELNGGSLRVELDGDLFKAIVTLPLLVGMPPMPRAEPEETPSADAVEPEAADAAAEEAAKARDAEEAAEPAGVGE